MWRYLRFLGADADEAADLTQETFVSVVGKPVERFGVGGARAYLRRVAKNAWLKRLERRTGLVEVDSDLVEQAYDWYLRDDDGAGVSAALDACLEELPARTRHALGLRFEQRMHREAMAQELDLGEEGVKSLLQRAYARLRTCIEARLGHGS